MNEATPVDRRLHRFFAWGGWLFLIGLILAVGGGGTVWVAHAAEVAIGADRAEVPEPLTFESHGGDYRLTLLADPLGLRWPYNGDTAVAELVCTIELSDGTSREVDGGVQLSRLETDVGIEIGDFAAPAGPTTATCVRKDGRESRYFYYSVAETRPLVAIVATSVAILGLAVLAFGSWLLIRGFAARSNNLKRL